MVHVFTLELLWLFSRAEESNEFPTFAYRYLGGTPLPAPGVPKEAIWCVIYRAGPIPSCYVLLNRPPPADTRPHSPTTLTNKSNTSTTISSTYAVDGKANHASTCAYPAFFSYPCRPRLTQYSCSSRSFFSAI